MLVPVGRGEDLAREPEDHQTPCRWPGDHFSIAGLDEIKRWGLSLGPECQVLGPERLKELVRGDLMETLGQYGALRVIPQTVHAHAKLQRNAKGFL